MSTPNASIQRVVSVMSRCDGVRRLLAVASLVARDAAGHLLIGAARRGDAAVAHALEPRLVAQHRVLDVFEDLAERLGLVMVRVDIDDAEILVAALRRLLGRMGEERRRVELLERQVAND